MKNILILTMLLFTSISFAQKDRTLELNKETNLIEVVYFHDNGMISQTGSYTTDGQLEGDWLSYDADGKKIASAQYDNGQKVGKWFFWTNDTLKEVDYSDNAISSVSEWTNTSSLALRN